MNHTPSVTGQALVTRIEELANSEVENAQKAVWASAESIIQAEFRRRGLELSAHETLQVLRKFDVNISSKPMTVKIMESIWEALDGLRGDISAQDMPEFATFLKGEYFKAKKTESSKRVLLTHVNAALRCFRRRYVNSWQSFYGDSFKADEFLKDVDALGERRIENSEDLIDWAKEVVDLSNRYGVDRESRLKATRENRIINRPVGIISLSSEGPYLRQWTAWISANADQIMSGRSSKTTPDITWRMQTGEPVFVEVKRNFKSKEAVTVEIASLVDAAVTGKTEWSDLEEALTAISDWTKLLEVAWGNASASVSAKLAVQTETVNLSFNLPAGDLHSLSIALLESLNRISTTLRSK